MTRIWILAGWFSLGLAAEQTRRVPTVDDLLKVQSLGGSQISPDGKWVAFSIGESDFKQDAYVDQIWLASTGGGAPLQRTRGEITGNPRGRPTGMARFHR